MLAVLFAQEAEFQPSSELQAAGLARIIGDSSVGVILVAGDGADVKGMVNLLFTVSTALGGRVAILEDMVVDPRYRGAGIGSRLLRAAIEQAAACECRRVTLLTDSTNETAQRFYRRHGFADSAMLPMRLSLG